MSNIKMSMSMSMSKHWQQTLYQVCLINKPWGQCHWLQCCTQAKLQPACTHVTELY